MTESTTLTERLAQPEIERFLAVVRGRLRDLPDEEQQDLLLGLEADLSELVAERGLEALGDPGDYARELRSAAGHAPDPAPATEGRDLPAAVRLGLDSAHASWDRLLDSLPGRPRGFLESLQPVWWVARGLVAWLVAQDLRGPWVVLSGFWLTVLAVFVVVSVQLGRGAWGWASLRSRSGLARLVLAGLNVFAVAMLPGAVDRAAYAVAEDRAWAYQDGPVVNDWTAPSYRGRQLCVIRAFDAEGRRIQGVRLEDADGRAIPARTREC